jgi:hypothetical protein
MLDQEKPCDRVHPEYLASITKQVGIPGTIIQCIITLFFSTIQVNINGHLSTQLIIQERGLRHGDPLSPLLLNIALILSLGLLLKIYFLLALTLLLKLLYQPTLINL